VTVEASCRERGLLAVVLQMRQAIKNGRKIEQLLCRNAQDIIKQHRQNRKKRSN
jgi:hypothetical protein